MSSSRPPAGTGELRRDSRQSTGSRRRPRIPVGTFWTPKDGATCSQCGATIKLQLQASGKWRPHNLDGEVHFATCVARKKPRTSVCPHCGSALYETIYTDVPPPHYARGLCTECHRSWWIGKPGAEAAS